MDLLGKQRGDLVDFVGFWSEQERICYLLDLPAALQAALGNKGVLLCALGDFEGPGVPA